MNISPWKCIALKGQLGLQKASFNFKVQLNWVSGDSAVVLPFTASLKRGWSVVVLARYKILHSPASHSIFFLVPGWPFQILKVSSQGLRSATWVLTPWQARRSISGVWPCSVGIGCVVLLLEAARIIQVKTPMKLVFLARWRSTQTCYQHRARFCTSIGCLRPHQDVPRTRSTITRCDGRPSPECADIWWCQELNLSKSGWGEGWMRSGGQAGLPGRVEGSLAGSGHQVNSS